MAASEEQTSVPPKEGRYSEEELRAVCDHVVHAHRHDDEVSFLGWPFDAGLAWVQFPEGSGGWGCRRASNAWWMTRCRRRGRGRPRNSAAMTGICSGYSVGSVALRVRQSDGPLHQNVAIAPSLESPDDPLGRHPMPRRTEVCMRRRRRIDVWTDRLLQVDALFRDNTWNPAGEEVVVHEYRLSASADWADGRLVDVSADPGVLPAGGERGRASRR